MEHRVKWPLLAKFLNGECTTEEKKLIDTWLNTDKSNKEFLNELQKTWDASGNIYDKYKPDLTKGWEAIDRQSQNKPKTFNLSLSSLLKAAAILIVTIGLGYWFFSNANSFYMSSDEITAYQQIKEITLPDSTIITLNKGAVLSYEKFGKNGIREVSLKGEAFFEVQRDTSRPFIVSTNNIRTQVLGTSFNIKSYENIKISVKTGKVAVYDTEDPSKKVILKPNQQALYLKTDKGLIKTVSSDINYLAWKTGILTFQETPLHQVAQTLEQFYNVRIKVEDELKDLIVTTRFNNQSLIESINVLAITLDIKFNQTDETHITLIK